MSKGLKALKYLKENKRRHWLEGDNSNECLNCIEKELKRLEDLDSILNTGGGIWAENGIVSRKLKALEIIKNYGYFDEQGDLIVHLPTNRKQEQDLLNEVLQ